MLIALQSALACSNSGHDCVQARDCPSSDGPVEIGEGGGLGDSGSAGLVAPAGVGAAEWAGAGGVFDGASAGSAAEGGASANADSERPQVIGVSPADGSSGVSSDAPIVLEFNTRMDAVSTEAACTSTELPSDQLSFTWNSDFTVLTLTPRAELRYAAAEPESPAQIYHFVLAPSARDRQGQALRRFGFSFSTLRRGVLELRAEPERTGNWTAGEGEGIHNCTRLPKAPYLPTVCVGDDANDVRYSGFVSFDLSELPSDLSKIESARLLASGALHGSPASLGANSIEHVAFGDLAEPALDAGPSSPLGPFLGADALSLTRCSLDVDLTRAVADDYAARLVLSGQTQYRLSFAAQSSNGHWDDLELPTSGIWLAVSYLLP